MPEPGAQLHERTLHRALPPALGILTDVGLALALVIVLVGWGPVGTIAGVTLGIASLAGIMTFALRHMVGRDRQTDAPEVQPAYALVPEQTWQQQSRRAA